MEKSQLDVRKFPRFAAPLPSHTANDPATFFSGRLFDLASGRYVGHRSVGQHRRQRAGMLLRSLAVDTCAENTAHPVVAWRGVVGHIARAIQSSPLFISPETHVEPGLSNH